MSVLPVPVVVELVGHAVACPEPSGQYEPTGQMFELHEEASAVLQQLLLPSGQ
jgi:hypothetical protein